MIRLLEERHFPVERLLPAATARSAGKTIVFRGEHVPIITLEQALHTTRHRIICRRRCRVKVWAPLFVEKGWQVVDNSSYWRMTQGVPLIVQNQWPYFATNGPADCQPQLLHHTNGHGPGSVTQSLWAATHSGRHVPIGQRLRPQRRSTTGTRTHPGPNPCGTAGCSTHQAGAAQPDADITQAQSLTAQPETNITQAGQRQLPADSASPYPCPIDLNVIPQIGNFLEDGYSEEEHKMMDETKKILNDPSIGVSATTVRVPVYGAHCVSMNVQLARPFTLDEVRRLLSSFPGLVLTDGPKGQAPFDDPESGPGLTSESRYGLAPGVQPALGYATPLTAKGSDAVYVSRVRRDTSIENGLELWTVADNIRKGAALNAVQIAEYLLMLRGIE